MCIRDRIRASSKISLDELFSKIKEGEVKDLNLIIKADVQGSVEAVKQSLERQMCIRDRSRPLQP